MSAPITESSVVQCDHGGTVQLRAGQSKLTVNGGKVLVAGDFVGAAISLCLTVPAVNSGTVTCALVASASGGLSQKLTVQGRPVLLEEINGQTTGTVTGTVQNWSVKSAGQTKLQTV